MVSDKALSGGFLLVTVYPANGVRSELLSLPLPELLSGLLQTFKWLFP